MTRFVAPGPLVANAGFSRGSGVAVGCVRGALLMGGENMGDPVLVFVQRIVDIENCTAGVPENGIHALFDQDFCKNFSSC